MTDFLFGGWLHFHLRSWHVLVQIWLLFLMRFSMGFLAPLYPCFICIRKTSNCGRLGISKLVILPTQSFLSFSLPFMRPSLCCFSRSSLHFCFLVLTFADNFIVAHDIYFICNYMNFVFLFRMDDISMSTSNQGFS